jgi:hypothetical protein
VQREPRQQRGVDDRDQEGPDELARQRISHDCFPFARIGAWQYSAAPERYVTRLAGFTARLKGVAAFVAIVWSVATTFIIFELIAVGGTDAAMGNPELLGDLALSPVVTRSTVCAGQPTDAPTPQGPSALAGAWSLGLAFGREAVLRQQESIATPQALAELRAGVEESAADIGVPPPEAFIPRQIANAHPEFVAFLEADGRQTGRALTKRDSRACHIYKLGAVWGYSEVGRIILPESRSIFAIEIRYYARQAELPDELWRPMLETQPSTTRAEVRARIDVLTANIERYLAESR